MIIHKKSSTISQALAHPDAAGRTALALAMMNGASDAVVQMVCPEQDRSVLALCSVLLAGEAVVAAVEAALATDPEVAQHPSTARDRARRVCL